MRKTIFILTFIAVPIITSSIISCESKTNSGTPSSQKISPDSLVKHGEYLVTVMGCDDCHSPKIMGARGPELDMQKRLSGYPSDRPLLKASTNNFTLFFTYLPINLVIVWLRVLCFL